MSDLYNILGVGRDADQEEIKRAYRKLAAQHHPDRGGDTKKFQELQSAYDTLSDPQKRAEYDSPQPQGFHFNQGGFPPGFEEIFSQFGDPFGGMFRRQTVSKNKNLNIQTVITLEDAYAGKELIAQMTLPSGRSETIQLKIPPGIQNGVTLRVPGIGDDSIPNLPRGDIHLTVLISEHARFTRSNDDLVMTFNLNCLEAIVGTTISIHTIDGKKLDVTIPEGTQHGQIFAFHGYGMPNMSDIRLKGRLLLQINISVPSNLSIQQKDAIRNLIN